MKLENIAARFVGLAFAVAIIAPLAIAFASQAARIVA